MRLRHGIGALIAVLTATAAVAALGAALAIRLQRPRLSHAEGAGVVVNSVLGRPGQRLPDRSALVTGVDSTCTVQLGTRLIVSLGPNTWADLDVGASPPRVDLRYGSLVCIANGPAESGKEGRQTAAVRTESCLVQAGHGTFYVRVEDDPAGRVCTCGASRDPPATYIYAGSGVLRVTDRGGILTQVDAAHDRAFRFAVRQGLPAVSSTGPEYEAQATVDEVAERTGLTLHGADGSQI